jgi:hypothetical protein
MMRVLQLGTINWQEKYTIPNQITWCFKDPAHSLLFDNKKKERYHLLIITSPIYLSRKSWEKLRGIFPTLSILLCK